MPEFQIFYPVEKYNNINIVFNIMFKENYSWDMYEKVHVISAETIDEVFLMAQNGNGFGWENTGLRSLCIGDVVVDESGKAWFCHLSGWSSFDDLLRNRTNWTSFNNQLKRSFSPELN